MLRYLEGCEVYACDNSAQVFVDSCKNCRILLGPCESTIFVRDCDDCTVWCAAQQFRSRDSQRCTFYLYTKTAPIIEASYDLTIAPWCAKYPCAGAQFDKARFDVSRNMWNAIFDFSGEKEKPHWRIPALDEIQELHVTLDGEGPPENLVPKVSHEMLCAPALESDEPCGQGLSIPQPAPPLPERTEGGPSLHSVTDKPEKRMPAIPAPANPEPLQEARQDAEITWTCPICTLDNKLSLGCCAACGYPRRSIAPSAGGLPYPSSRSSEPDEPPKQAPFCSFLMAALRCAKAPDRSRT